MTHQLQINSKCEVAITGDESHVISIRRKSSVFSIPVLEKEANKAVETSKKSSFEDEMPVDLIANGS